MCCFLTILLVFDEFADKHSATLNFGLVNELDLTKILKVEIFVHTDGQLRAAHLILNYNLLPSSFQAPKYVIKARDPHLHQINITVPDFFILGPFPTGVQQVELLFQHVAEEEATPSQPMIKEEEQVVEVSNFEDEFEVFN